MGRPPSLISINEFIHAHLDARPLPHLPTIARCRILERPRLVAAACKARIVTAGTQPFYDWDEDLIAIPSPAFYTLACLIRRPVAYAIDMLHELTHWTGHRRRLDRRRPRQPFDAIYLREELIAELGAALLCHDLAITSRPALPHARYLNGYLCGLPNPTIDLAIALSHANQAAAYLTAVSRREIGD